VRLVLQRGDLTAARVTLLGRGLDPDRTSRALVANCTPLAEFDLIALARLWLAEGRRAEADELLDELAAKAAGQGRQRRAFMLRLLQSLSRLEGGLASPTILQPLIEILPLARREGFLRSVLDEGAPARRLLDLARSEAEAWPSRAAQSEARPYLEKLSAVFAGGMAEATGEAGALMLSKRELDVVRLLGRGHSNRRLAGELAMAPDTVKWHLKNIFGKLGVASRSQAILEAQRRGLLV